MVVLIGDFCYDGFVVFFSVEGMASCGGVCNGELVLFVITSVSLNFFLVERL